VFFAPLALAGWAIFVQLARHPRATLRFIERARTQLSNNVALQHSPLSILLSPFPPTRLLSLFGSLRRNLHLLSHRRGKEITKLASFQHAARSGPAQLAEKRERESKDLLEFIQVDWLAAICCCCSCLPE